MAFSRNFIYFNNQSYVAIRQEHFKNSTLFCDDTFGADDKSISPSGKQENLSSIEWKRPAELCVNPCLFIAGSSVHDVCQGSLGNCWLVSALAVLAQHPEYLKKVIPNIEDQEWHGNRPHSYTGMFRICLWRYGEWLEVVIDDRLPSRNGKLIFVHSKVKNEFWSALIEKAYAKVCGSYEALIGGLTCESLVDFTGGIPEQVIEDIMSGNFISIDIQVFDLKKYSKSDAEMENLFKLLQFDWKDGSLMCASIASRSNEMEEKLVNGLITTHAYSITGVCKLRIKSTPIYEHYRKSHLMCIRLRNPWGQKEWKGSLSDASEEWHSISYKDKLAMGWKVENDGEFWMLIDDFLVNFNEITIIRLIKTGIFKYNTNWFGSMCRGYWTGVAGDRQSALSEVGQGGQFKIEINNPKGDIFLCHLLQKCARGHETALGILIIAVERNRNFMVHTQKFCNVKLEYRLGGSRSICLRYRLPCGTYIIKPFLTVASPGLKFPIYYLLRCYTTQKNNGTFLPSEMPIVEMNCMCKSNCTIIICRLHIIQADIIQSAEELDVLNIFCEINCENQTFRTTVNCNTSGLVWDESFLLHRSKMDRPIIIKIFHRGRFFNTLLGYSCCSYDSRHLNSPEVIETLNMVFEPKLQTPCTKIKNLKITQYHTDNQKYL